MRLTTDELREIPLAGAWYREDGTQTAKTPEWSGGGVDTVQYRYGPLRLVVETEEHRPEIADLSQRVLAELDALAVAATPELAAVRRSLCASLSLVMGRLDPMPRSTEEVIATVHATAREENVVVSPLPSPHVVVPSGDSVALVLKQLATNARKHDGAEDMALSADKGGTFRLRWRGNQSTGRVSTSRHPDQRAGWGLGLVRLAADALGASVITVRHGDDGTSEAVFAPLSASGRFSLPLAAVSSDGVVERATRAWDEETGLTPGSRIPDELTLLCGSTLAGGRAISHGAFSARRGLRRTWIAMRPRSTREQARDLVAGIAHERALVGDGADATRLVGSAAALSLLLGSPIEMWLRTAVDDQLPLACQAFNAPIPRLIGEGRSAPPAPLIAFLVAEASGGEFEFRDGVWVFRPEHTSDLIGHLVADGVVPIGSRSLVPA